MKAKLTTSPGSTAGRSLRMRIRSAICWILGWELNIVDINVVDIVQGQNASRGGSMTKTGRRAGDSGTRHAIATAAQRQFGERGFAKTTIRSIAEEAGVDPALIMQFFGSKDQLFAQSIRWPFDPVEEIGAVIGGDRTTAGARLVALFLRTWDAERGRNPMVALLRAATTQDAAAGQLRDFLEHELLMPLVEGLHCDSPAVRANLVATHLLGLGVARYALRFQPLAAMHPEEVVALLAPLVQSALTAPLPTQRRDHGHD